MVVCCVSVYCIFSHQTTYELHDYKRYVSFVHCGVSSSEHHAGQTADSQMLWNPFLPFLGFFPMTDLTRKLHYDFCYLLF